MHDLDTIGAIAEVCRGIGNDQLVLHHCGSQRAADNMADYVERRFGSDGLKLLTTTWAADMDRRHVVIVDPFHCGDCEPGDDGLIRRWVRDLRTGCYLIGQALLGRSQ